MARQPRIIRSRRFSSQIDVIPMKLFYEITNDPYDGPPTVTLPDPTWSKALNFLTTDAPGTVIATLTNPIPGEVVTITPNNGKVYFTQNQLRVGATSSSAGSISYTITRTHAHALNSPHSTITSIATTSSLVTRAIAGKGEVSTGFRATTGGKTRVDSRIAFPVRKAATRVRFLFTNCYINTTTGWSAGTDALVVNLASIEKGATSTPVTSSSSRSFTVPAGATNFLTDWITITVAPGDTVYFRTQADVGAGFPSSGTQTGDQSWSYLPATAGNNIDTTGLMSAPSGGTTEQVCGPIMMLGEVSANVVAMMGIFDSLNRSNDFVGTIGNDSGGYARRACYDMNVPYTSMGLNGMQADDYAQASALTFITALSAYHSDVLSETSVNDVGVYTSSAILTDLRAIWGAAKTGGATRVWQTTCTPSTTSTDVWTTLATQVPRTNFTTGGVRDQLNTSLFANVGSNGLTGVVDVSAIVQDTAEPTKWKVRTFATTLPSGATSSQTTSVVFGSSVSYGMTLVADPGGASQSTTAPIVTTSAGGTTVTLNAGFGVTQSAGAVVKETPTSDGLHPSARVHVEMKAPLIAAITPYL